MGISHLRKSLCTLQKDNFYQIKCFEISLESFDILREDS